jgi:hypothetical protein
VKSANSLFLLLVLLVTGPVRALCAARNAASAPVSAPAYVRLTDWAKANQLELRWLKPDETLQLSNSSSKLVLAVDSRQAQVNGVTVWLLYPVTAHLGTVRVSEADVDLTLRPLLAPLRARAGGRVKHICLDPGHGGNDPGNRVGKTSSSNCRGVRRWRSTRARMYLSASTSMRPTAGAIPSREPKCIV